MGEAISPQEKTVPTAYDFSKKPAYDELQRLETEYAKMS
jgi:hypothetical protein